MPDQPRAPFDDNSVEVGKLIPVRYTPDLFLHHDELTVLPRDAAHKGTTFDAEVHVLTYGEKTNPAVMLLSGLSVPWFDWQKVAHGLAHDHYVVVFERIGSGLSTATDGQPPGTLASEVDIVNQVMDATGIEQAHIVAHSMAGFIGEAFTLIHPEKVTRLTLLDGSYEPRTRGRVRDIHQLWESTRTPSLVEKFNRIVLDFDTARKVFAHTWQFNKPERDRALREGHDHRLMVRLAQTEAFVDGMLRELRGYELWAEELAYIDRHLPLQTQTVVVAACQDWANLKGKFLGRWQRKLLRHAEGLATRNVGSEVYFMPIQATHMMMRDNSTAIIRIVRGSDEMLSRYRVDTPAGA